MNLRQKSKIRESIVAMYRDTEATIESYRKVHRFTLVATVAASCVCTFLLIGGPVLQWAIAVLALVGGIAVGYGVAIGGAIQRLPYLVRYTALRENAVEDETKSEEA
jgi:Na+/proline symporter